MNREILRVAFLVLMVGLVNGVGWGQTNYYYWSGSVSSTSSWWTNTDGTGSNPSNFTTNNQIFNIQNAQSPTLSGTWTISGTNSRLKILAGGTFTTGGNNPTLTLDMEGGATYIVNSSYTSLTFGNLDNNSTFQLNSTSGFAPTRVYPNLTLNFSGIINPGNSSITTNGNLTINSGAEFRGTNTNSPVHTIGGSLIINSGGTWVTTNGSGIPTYNISGTISNSGTITASATNGTATISLNGTSDAIVNWGTKTGHRHNVNIANGKAVTFADNFQIGTGTLFVNGTINCGSNVISGSGTFTLASGATLITANTAGITSSGSTGSIQTTTRNFNTGASYVYNGSAAQVFGDGLPATVAGLTIANGADITLPSTMTITSQLNLTNGRLILEGNNLIVGSGGTLSGGSATTYIQTNGAGTLQQTIGNASGSVTFPIGNFSYNPAILTNSGTSDVFSVRVEDQVLANGTSGNAITSRCVNRTWFVSENVGGGSNVSLTVQWSQSDELNSFTRNACYLSHYTMGGWLQDSEGGASGANPYTRSRSDITSFSPFSIGSQGALPVELTNFDVAAAEKQVALSWSTATELNNHYFQIERSADSRTFETIGKVEGAGTSYETLHYTFKDEQPLAGWNYYRLKQVDFDGQFDYSPVRAVLMGQTAKTNERLEFFPNPAGDEIFIQSPTRVVSGDQVEIYDQFGRLVLQVQLAETQDAPIRLSALPAGVYVARLQTANGFAVGKFLVKR